MSENSRRKHKKYTRCMYLCPILKTKVQVLGLRILPIPRLNKKILNGDHVNGDNPQVNKYNNKNANNIMYKSDPKFYIQSCTYLLGDTHYDRDQCYIE